MPTTRLKHIFEPLQIGPMRIRNRIMLPPHASAIGNLWGSEEDAARHIGYLASRVESGAAWVTSITGYLENLVAPGFDPSGVGARIQGIYRRADYLDRMGRFAEAIHAAGGVATSQVVIQGGMPHGPSQTLSGPVINLVPHALTRAEIRWFVAEYRYSAERAKKAGIDGIEIHANHDDVIEWFISPKTNRRSDEYGGSFANRMRYLDEIISEMREGVGKDFVIGVRMNMLEQEPGGYDATGGAEVAAWLQASGKVDYLHLVMGSPWGDPSYVQPHYYKPAQWAEITRAVRRNITLPVVYTGKVLSPAVAEQVISSGAVDVVGMARAHVAERDIVGKARRGELDRIRPCIGCNECIARHYVEAIPFGCTVNPAAGYEKVGAPAKTSRAKRLLVVGGGPAGMELAATARERGHSVELWERGGDLGGQMRLAAKLPTQETFLEYLDYQERRLADLGVVIRKGYAATAEGVIAFGADAVAIATGARARRPDIPGIDGPDVHDAWQILKGEAKPGQRVAVISQDDHITPLALADHLATRGSSVTLICSTNAPGPLLSRYTAGGIFARLSRGGVRIVAMEEVTEIALPNLKTRHVYSGLRSELGPFDSVALACGALSETGLFEELDGKLPELHILGDAYAPRRTVFATKQGYMLGAMI